MRTYAVGVGSYARKLGEDLVVEVKDLLVGATVRRLRLRGRHTGDGGYRGFFSYLISSYLF